MRWSGPFEDARFFGYEDCRFVATETERRPNLGPGVYKLPHLRQGEAASFAPAPGIDRVDRLDEKCMWSLDSEIARNAEMGPAAYDIVKYDTFPEHEHKSELAARSPIPVMAKEERFKLSCVEREFVERKQREEFRETIPSAFGKGRYMPRMSQGHRFTPREKHLVPHPSQFLQTGQGVHMSQARKLAKKRTRSLSRGVRSNDKKRMVPVSAFRSQSVAPPASRPMSDADYLKTLAAGDKPDPFRGLGPYKFYDKTLECRLKYAPNYARCGIASIVPRDDETIIGVSTDIMKNPHLGPGKGFDTQDQVQAAQFWGPHFAWERWKQQSTRGLPPGEVDKIVAQVAVEKKNKKRRQKSDSKTATIQSTWHGMLQDEVKVGSDWAARPVKYAELLAKETAHLEALKSGTNDSLASLTSMAPVSVNIKSSSDAAVTTVDI